MLPVLLLLTALTALHAVALAPLEIKGNKFFSTDDGSQFYIKGVAYQRSPDDPLTDGTQCQVDAAMMATLGTNMIRVYHVDSQADHTACMQAFEDNGIYLIVDLSTFDTAILQSSPEWNQTMLSYYVAVLNNFARFPNTAGYFIGNEVIDDQDGSGAALYIKAAVADVKTYLAKHASSYTRPQYVGYSAADIASLRPMLQNYLACGASTSSIDFFGLNAYEWCAPNDNMQTSGYDNLNNFLIDSQFNVPFFFSETGCNVAPPRTFGDQAAVFSENMTEYWSGAIIYEWIQEENDYGLIAYDGPDYGEGLARLGNPIPIVPDFENLKSAWAAVSPSSINIHDYTSTNPPVACPASTAGVWNVDPNAALPTLGDVATTLDFSTTIAPSITAQPDPPPSSTPVSTPVTTSSSATSATESTLSSSTTSIMLSPTTTTSGSSSSSASSTSAATTTAAYKNSAPPRDRLPIYLLAILPLLYIILQLSF